MRSIAVIDDFDDTRQLLRLTLEPQYEVHLFETGTDFVKTLGIRKFDLILLDIRMPDLTGFDVIQKIQALPEYRGVPVVGLSANAMPSDHRKAAEAGFAAYVTKPFDLDALLLLVEKLL